MAKTQRSQKQAPTKRKSDSHNDTAELTFLEHIYELRSRAFWIVFAIIVASAAGFQFKDQLIAVVMEPLHGQKLVYLTPGGGFGFIFTLAMYFGVLVAIPVIVYHVYGFLRPLLQRASRKLVALFMILSCLLAAAGAAFGYFVTIPAALSFLATFAGDAVTPNLTAESYLNFFVAYVLGLAFLFQLPLLLFLFDHVRKFPPGSLLSTQRFVIVGATIVSAVITPTPDAVNMAIVALPIIGMYQFGVIAVFIRHQAQKRALRRKARRDEQVLADAIPQVAKQETSGVFTGTQTHMPISIAPERPRTRSGVFTRVTSSETADMRRVSVPRSGRAVDGFVSSRPDRTGSSSLQSASARRLAAAQAAYVRPVRSVDGFRVAEYQANS